MPELPEVETTRRGVQPFLLNHKVSDIIVRQAKLRWAVPTKQIRRHMLDQVVRRVDRRGKYLLLAFDSGTLLIHLGMSGSLRIIEVDEPAMAHDHVDLILDGSKALRFHDPRRFGAVLWTTAAIEDHKLIAHLGPEPLTDALDGAYLYAQSRQRKVPIKSFIMDARVVVGVGNIYANESLFRAGIHPKRAAGRVGLVRYEKLADEIKSTLQRAIADGGTTLRDFVGGDGKPGYFKQSLFVYGRGGKACKLCASPLKEIRLQQRTTVFCQACQK